MPSFMWDAGQLGTLHPWMAQSSANTRPSWIHSSLVVQPHCLTGFYVSNMFNNANDVWKKNDWDSLRYILKEFLKRPLACGIVAYYVQALQKMLLRVCPFSGFPSCMSAWCMNPSAWMAIPYHPTVFPLAHKLCSSFHAAGANIGRCWRCTERCQELLEFQWVSIFFDVFCTSELAQPDRGSW